VFVAALLAACTSSVPVPKHSGEVVRGGPDGTYVVPSGIHDFVISVISVATRKIVYQYGTPGVPGSGPNHLDNPDDALLAPGGHIVARISRTAGSSPLRHPRTTYCAPSARAAAAACTSRRTGSAARTARSRSPTAATWSPRSTATGWTR
jgi:hypothetical protein